VAAGFGPMLALPIHDAVLRYGRDYIGVVRPKGLRHQRARQQCFWNAADAATQDRGQYVEGFVMHRRHRAPIHHAWLTGDGVRAIDQTLPDARDYDYLGIPFSNAVLVRAIWTRRDVGILTLLAEQPEPAAEILGLDLIPG